MNKQNITRGHCENNKLKGGCPLHNLHCSWPKCDEKPQTRSITATSAMILLSGDALEISDPDYAALRKQLEWYKLSAERYDKLASDIDEGRAAIIVEGDSDNIDGGVIYTDLAEAIEAINRVSIDGRDLLSKAVT